MKLFNELEAQHGLPNGLLKAVMQQESGGNTRAVSPKGARGAFQFMPATAKQYGVDVDDLTSSATGAAKMYADLLKQNGGDLNKALAGYNWGQGNVQRKGLERMPAETKQYIQKVTANMQPQIDKSKIQWDEPQIDKAQIKWDDAPQAAQAKPEESIGKSASRLYKGAQIGVLRGVKDVIDTGADWLSNLGGAEENARVKALNTQGKAEFDAQYGNNTGAQVGRVGGNVIATLPVGGVFGQVATKAGLPALGTALRTGGFRTGLPAAPLLSRAGAANMGTRMLGGGGTAMGAQTLIDGGTENAGTAGTIGALLPPGLKFAGEAGKLLNKGTGGLVKHTLGMTTGTGAESISAAYNAGKNKAGAFLDNMRGNVPFDDVVDDVKSALGKMREARAADYRSGMVDISNDKSIIPFQPIDDAVRKIGQMGSYKGQRINKNASGTVDDLMATVDNWRGLDPAEYHTPEGLDALKQAIGDIRDTTQFGTAARRAADEVYNAVKNQITAQAPTYAKVMKDYSEASTLLKEIESGLSVGPNKSRDAAVRKLQSLLRNNAQTNYGNRLNLARQLEEKGGADLMPALAGQSMNALMPRGITGAIQKGGALVTAGATQGASIVPTLLAAPISSPRLVGEALYGMGRLRGAAGSAAGKGGNALTRITGKHPELLEKSRNALYRAAPVMAISATQGSQR